MREKDIKKQVYKPPKLFDLGSPAMAFGQSCNTGVDPGNLNCHPGGAATNCHVGNDTAGNCHTGNNALSDCNSGFGF